MKYILLPFGLSLAMCAAAHSQPIASDSSAAAPSIPYSTVQVIGKDDSPAVVAEKAAKVLPRPNQTDWFRMERTFFIHFGPNTFRGVEWGSGRENPSVFNPTAFDAEQWIRAIKDAGGKMVVPVCKHHDGLCLWQTRYTNHSVASSPWRGGKGDELRDIADAAKKYGVKLGVYLSPADLYQLRTNPTNTAGYYGNRSPKLRSTIPTDPASFKTDPSKGRTPPEGFKTYTYEVDDYNRYFLNQLYELLTEYGPIHEVWFDGANPDPSVRETYDYAAWYDLIRKLRPEAIIFGKGPDGRWVGNEGGVGRTTEWSVIPLPKSPETFQWPDMTARDLGSRSKLIPGSYLWWYPAEVNVPILYGWFWAPGKGVRTAADLVNIYYQSVGRNGIWLLNLSPDTRGLIPDDQLASLRLASQVIRDTFAKNLAAGAEVTADSFNPAYPPSLALDGNLDTWWEAAPGKTTAELILKLPSPATFDVVSLQEAVDHRGQRIESFSIDVWDGSKWKTVDTQEERTTVGFKRLSRLRSPANTDQVRIRITGSRLEPTLAEIGLFKQAELVQPPVISDRDVNGSVTISSPKGLPVVYATDGGMPTPDSTVYRSPISLPRGGTVNAACLAPNGRLGMMASKRFSGYAPTGWKVVAVDNQETSQPGNAAHAIDGNPSTLWQTADSPLPHSLTVDMGRPLRIGGLGYVPPRGRNRTGVVDTYRFETSDDGKNWTTNINQGRFGNIRNNPIPQEVPFAPVTARYFRFTALREVNGNNSTSAAEITVLPAETDQSQPVSKTFMDYFLPTPVRGALTRDTWGADGVLPRDIQNGLEDATMKRYCYWDGQIIKARDGKYHMFASRWDQSRGHNGWFGSVAVHAVSDSLTGPYVDKGLCWPGESGGRGHNVTALTLADGRYAVVISETRPCEVYVSNSLDGPWEHLGTITVEGEPRWHASNVAIMLRPDGKYEITERDGRVFISDRGVLGPYKSQGGSVFPRGIPNLEDPCIWYSGGLYHILVNSWSTRKAYHLTSPDGVHGWTNRGVAYDPRAAIVRYSDGTVNRWNKLERPSVYVENGHVAAVTLAAIDVEKDQDKGNDKHGSKVIVIPFDGESLDRDLNAATGAPDR